MFRKLRYVHFLHGERCMCTRTKDGRNSFHFCCVLNGGLPRISKKTIMFSSKPMALGISHFKKRPCVVLAISSRAVLFAISLAQNFISWTWAVWWHRWIAKRKGCKRALLAWPTHPQVFAGLSWPRDACCQQCASRAGGIGYRLG